VDNDIGGRAGRVRGAFVLLHVKGDGGEADGLADQKADALDVKDRLR
jgi:hypothetical protein